MQVSDLLEPKFFWSNNPVVLTLQLKLSIGHSFNHRSLGVRWSGGRVTVAVRGPEVKGERLCLSENWRVLVTYFFQCRLHQ